MTNRIRDLKDSARRVVESRSDDLVELSHRVHATPELGFEEEHASLWVAEALADYGYQVTKPAFDLPTAFTASKGSGPLSIAICAEYDALPGVGHACGHNIIASSAVGAGAALAPLVDDLGVTVSVIGTPAEERGDASGKILLLERGAFDNIHAAMMVHPAPQDIAMPNMVAAAMFDVSYVGKEAHAAGWPWLGVNAADALVVAQVGIGLLRQHIEPAERVHGIVTRGGDAPNIIPAHATGRWMVRSGEIERLQSLRDRVMKCFEAGALATGSEMAVKGGYSPYAEVRHDRAIAQVYERNAVALGRSFVELDRPSGSTDMGNVSLSIPTIHPFIGIDCGTAVNHQPEFTAACAGPAADRAVVDAAIAMAWTVIDLALDDGHRDRLLSRG